MHRSLISSWKELPREFWVLFAGTFVNRVGTFVAPFLALYLSQERALPPVEIGLVIGSYGVGLVFAGPIGGLSSDVRGRRFTMVAALMLSAGGMFALGFAQSTIAISFWAFWVGICGEMYRPAVSAVIADLVQPDRHKQAFGLLYWVMNLGVAIGAVLAGFFAEIGYILLFIGDALTTVASAALIFWMIKETRPAKGLSSSEVRMSRLIVPLKDARLMLFVFLSLGIYLVYIQHGTTLPLDMQLSGISARNYGMLIAINALLVVCFQPLFARIFSHVSPGLAMALAATLTGVGFGAIGFARSVPMYALSIAIWTAGEMIMSPVAPAVVASLSPTELRGLYQGTYQLSWGLAVCAGPLIGSEIFGSFSPGTLWLSCLALGLLSGLGFILLDRFRGLTSASRPLKG